MRVRRPCDQTETLQHLDLPQVGDNLLSDRGKLYDICDAILSPLLAVLSDKILVCPDGQGRAREVGLPRHEHVFDAAGATATAVRRHAGPGDMRGSGRLRTTADREDLRIACGPIGVEELRRVALDDTSAKWG